MKRAVSSSRLALCLMLVAIVGLAGTNRIAISARSKVPLSPAQDYFSINTRGEWSQFYPSEIQDIQALGASQVRTFIFWVNVQPCQPGSPGCFLTPSNPYDWTAPDALINNLSAANLDVIAQFDGTPTWARNDSQHQVIAASHYGDFAAFVNAAVQRYPRVKVAEIFNEPDNLLSWGTSTSAYKQAICAAHTQVAGRTPISIGGLAYDYAGSGFYSGFLREVLSNGGGPCIEQFNFHNYPNGSWSSVAAAVADYRATLSTYYPAGLQKPLIWSESGASSVNSNGQFPGSEQRQAGYVAKQFTWGLTLNLSSVAWYYMHDYETVPCTDYYCFHGLVRWDQNHTHKPAFTAYSQAKGWLIDMTYYRTLPADWTNFRPSNYSNYGEGYSFDRQHPGDVNHGFVVAWNKAPQPNTTVQLKIVFPKSTSNLAGVWDIYGNLICLVSLGCPSSADGTQWAIPLPDDGTPVYAVLVQKY